MLESCPAAVNGQPEMAGSAAGIAGLGPERPFGRWAGVAGPLWLWVRGPGGLRQRSYRTSCANASRASPSPPLAASMPICGPYRFVRAWVTASRARAWLGRGNGWPRGRRGSARPGGPSGVFVPAPARYCPDGPPSSSGAPPRPESRGRGGSSHSPRSYGVRPPGR